MSIVVAKTKNDTPFAQATEASGASPQPIRYRPFGALRLVLALLVLAHHFNWLVPDNTRLRDLLWAYRLGDVAVLGFFVLSGLIVTEAAYTFYAGRPLAFATNRCLRIVPPLALALVVSVAVHLALDLWHPTFPEDFAPSVPYSDIFRPSNLAANVLGIIPFAEGSAKALPLTYNFLPYTWAIRIELEFYTVLAIALWAGARLDLSVLLTGIAVLAVAASFLHLPFGHFACFFALGGALYFALRGEIFPWFLALALTVACFHSFALTQKVDDPRTWATQHLALAIEIVAMCVLFHLKTVRLRRLDRLLGEMSYPLYLNQYVVVIGALVLVRPSLTALFVSVPTAVLFAFLAGRVIEPLTENLRDRIRGAQLA